MKLRVYRLLLTVAMGYLPTFASGVEVPVNEIATATEETLMVSHPLSGEGITQSFQLLSDEELDRKTAISIGATIGSEPGIHNSSFGTAVGRPVIRGLNGARVRVLEDRIDTLDVSVVSGDHAVTVEPLIAEQVEILKGPSTLLYGSGAIGGVVDVHTGRIPHNVRSGISGALELRAGDNSDGRNGAFRLDGGQGIFAWHIDGFSRNADDYKIPGFAESARQRALEAEGEDRDHEEEEPVRGTVAGTELNVLGGAAGFSFIGERGFVGFSVSTLDTEYGIPGHGHAEEEHSPGEEEEEGVPFLDLEQLRLDFEAALVDPLPGFTSLNLRFGINDYEHQETEPSGEIAAAFDSNAWEARAELSYGDQIGWRGVLGMQYSDRKFSVVGEEAFTAPVDTTALGLFWLGEKSFSLLQLEVGARFERVEHEPSVDSGGSSRFNNLNASIGLIVPLDEIWKAKVLADYANRAPVGEELYSNGPHLATRSFEIGNSELSKEKAVNLSVSLSGQGKDWSVQGELYRTGFSDFIYQMATGAKRDELMVREFRQADATFIGLELAASVNVAKWPMGRLELSGFFDTVSAELDIPGNDKLPRIPPQRVGLGLALNWKNLSANLDYVHAFKQEDVAEFELPTDAYGDLRAYLAWDLGWDEAAFTLFLQGHNLTNQEQRQHTSLLKDLAPEPGRTIEAGVRIRF